MQHGDTDPYLLNETCRKWTNIYSECPPKHTTMTHKMTFFEYDFQIKSTRINMLMLFQTTMTHRLASNAKYIFKNYKL